ncbi:hypothetical protein GGI35DRAFT_45044 [Trichoderma velutinum]
MAPKLRAKTNTHARMQRYSTQFNELAYADDPGALGRAGEGGRGNSTAKSRGPGGPGGPGSRPVKTFSWSDAGSTTNNTRRSSPTDLGEFSIYPSSLFICIIIHILSRFFLPFNPPLTYHSLSAAWPVTRLEPGMRNSWPRIFRDVEGAPCPAEVLGSSSH